MNRLLLIFTVLLLVACKEQLAVVDEDQSKEDYILTGITLSGEFSVLPEVPIVSVQDEDQMSRAANSDLYAIQVYSADKATSTYAKYAYGLFDDLSKAEVELSTRHFYKFVVMVVRDGKTKIKQSYGAYYEPFMVDTRPAMLDNKFAYSSLVQFAGLTLGRATIASDLKTYARPELDRYVGQKDGFQPVIGVPIDIELKRVVFGIRLSCQDMTDGYVELTIDGAPSMKINLDEQSVESIFTLQGSTSSNNWIEDFYVEDVVCRAKWYRDGHEPQIIGPTEGRTINVRRGYCTPIKIETTYPQHPISISFESAKLIDNPQVIF